MARTMLLLLTSVLAVLLTAITTNAYETKHKPHSADVKLSLDVGKLVIDTDAGVDDALAILLALGYEHNHGRVSVVAITCVQGNTQVDNVVVNVLKVLDTADRLDIPVYKGAKKPLVVPFKTDDFFGKDGFGEFEYPNPPSPEDYLMEEHAVTALIDIVNESPGEVTILCIGPLTNIALAIHLDPLFLSKIQQLVVLGGSVEGIGNVLPGIEFNFYADPEATSIVFNSTDTSHANIKPIVLFPWESVASRNFIPMGWRINVLGKMNSPGVNLMNKAEARSRTGPYWMPADGSVTAVVLNSSIVTTSRNEYLFAHVGGTEVRGAVFVDYMNVLNRPKNVILVKDIDVDSYKNLLLDNLSYSNTK